MAEILGAARVSGVEAPIEKATGLPGGAYSDAQVFELERLSIFSKTWFAAGFASDLPNPGDVLPVTIAGWELVLVRDLDGSVRCFHNICRHRGMKLVHEAASARTISCRYHCWTYSLKGELVATPHIGGPRIGDVSSFDRSSLGLRPVRCSQWRDVVFVDIGGEAPPLAEHLSPVDRMFADYELDQVRVAAEVRAEQKLPFNWKLLIEGGIESYHLPWVHPALELPPAGYFPEITGGDCYVGFSTPMSKEEMQRRAAGADPTVEGALPNFPHIDRQIAQGTAVRFYILFVLPNVTFILFPYYLIMNVMRPVAVDCTALKRKFYYVGGAATSPELAARRHGIAEYWERILLEDVPFLSDIQRMSRARHIIDMPTRLTPHWEVGLQKFQQYVLRNARH